VSGEELIALVLLFFCLTRLFNHCPRSVVLGSGDKNLVVK
jgi:hypothetical protein